MENKYVVRIKGLLLDFFKDEDVKIILFGSRARKDSHLSSDIDIGIIPGAASGKNGISNKIALLNDKIEDLNIPYKVEIVDLSRTSGDFRKQALKDAEIWKD